MSSGNIKLQFPFIRHSLAILNGYLRSKTKICVILENHVSNACEIFFNVFDNCLARKQSYYTNCSNYHSLQLWLVKK